MWSHFTTESQMYPVELLWEKQKGPDKKKKPERQKVCLFQSTLLHSCCDHKTHWIRSYGIHTEQTEMLATTLLACPSIVKHLYYEYSEMWWVLYIYSE